MLQPYRAAVFSTAALISIIPSGAAQSAKPQSLGQRDANAAAALPIVPNTFGFSQDRGEALNKRQPGYNLIRAFDNGSKEVARLFDSAESGSTNSVVSLEAAVSRQPFDSSTRSSH